ncbi:MAG: hypothetical protein DHS20C18_46980 [Saprospiraceae bacterium]|nr:MAG: hypothetical protein DHS20C18_46980 [Saprospiraceae bacterium]
MLNLTKHGVLLRILIIVAEQDLQDAIKASLENNETYSVETAGDFHTVYEKLFVYKYGCILLDTILPNGSGLDLLKEPFGSISSQRL